VHKINGAHTIVEMMRRGMSPKDACLEAIKRVSKNYNNDLKKLSQMMIIFQAVNKTAHTGLPVYGTVAGRAKTANAFLTSRTTEEKIGVMTPRIFTSRQPDFSNTK
jgi:hypothetical protein